MAKNKTIAIDIGHGSNTFPPSKGVTRGGKGYAEHTFNSKLAVELDKRLRSIGFKTILYQKPFSKDIPLTQRTNYYNAQKVDLVFSIHANANGNPKVNGRCVFYWGTSAQSKKLAEIIVANIKKAGYTTHGNGLHAGVRGSWTNLHINRETNMPAVLVENGFMTGDKDFDLIFGNKQDQYIKDMAKVHVDSISEYFGVKSDAATKTDAPSEPSTPTTSDNLYRVRKAWSDAKTQLGAFKSLANARALANKNAGYNVYDSAGKKVASGKSAAKPKAEAKSNITVDGKWGKDTTRALQKALGTAVDGIISRQPRNSVTTALYGGTISFGSGNGSPMVSALQRKIGAKADGKLGTETVRKLQAYLGTVRDGKLSRPSLVVKEMQRRLNNGRF